MRIKKFEQLYEDQDGFKNAHNYMFGNNKKTEGEDEIFTKDKIKEFHDKVKSIVDFDEDEYEQGDEPSHVDILSEVGSLMNQMNLTTQDIRDVVDAYPNDMYIEQYVKGQLEFDEKTEKQEKDVIDIIRKELEAVGVTVTDEVIGAVNNILFEIEDNGLNSEY